MVFFGTFVLFIRIDTPIFDRTQNTDIQMTNRVPNGRQRAAETVSLNIYDLSPMNDSGLSTIGLGFYHSGLEVRGREYTFSASGVFHHSPRQAPGVKFSHSVKLGEVRMSSSEVDSIVNALRQDYPGNKYNLLGCNCNSFANELCMKLTGERCPGYVNRLARIGHCFSCCLPKDLTGGSPVNDPSFGNSGSLKMPGTINRKSFTGAGQTLSSSSTSTGSSGGDAEARRRLMRAAALARLDKKKVVTVAPSE